MTKSYTVNPRSRRTINIDNETGFTGRPATERTLQSTDVSATDHLDQRRADPGRARDVHDGQRPRLRRRPRQRRRHGAADQLVPRRRLDRLVLRPVHPAGQPEHDADDGARSPISCRAARRCARSTRLPAQSRRTIYVDSEPGLANVATSAIVRSLNAAVPIVVERAMWWPDGNWTEAHNSAGRDRHLADLGARRRRGRRHVRQPDVRPRRQHLGVHRDGARDGLLRGSGIAARSASTTCRPTAASTSTTPTRSPRAAASRSSSRASGPTPSQEPQLVVERAMYSNSGSTDLGGRHRRARHADLPVEHLHRDAQRAVPEGAGRR